MKPEITQELSKYTIPDLKLDGVCYIKLVGLASEQLVLEGKTVRALEAKDLSDEKATSTGLPPNSIRTAPNECTTF